MEILRRGTIPSEITHEVTCSICNSLIRFKQGEAKYTSDQRDGDFLTITCPVCGGKIHKNIR